MKVRVTWDIDTSDVLEDLEELEPASAAGMLNITENEYSAMTEEELTQYVDSLLENGNCKSLYEWYNLKEVVSVPRNCAEVSDYLSDTFGFCVRDWREA